MAKDDMNNTATEEIHPIHTNKEQASFTAGSKDASSLDIVTDGMSASSFSDYEAMLHSQPPSDDDDDNDDSSVYSQESYPGGNPVTPDDQLLDEPQPEASAYPLTVDEHDDPDTTPLDDHLHEHHNGALDQQHHTPPLDGDRLGDLQRHEPLADRLDDLENYEPLADRLDDLEHNISVGDHFDHLDHHAVMNSYPSHVLSDHDLHSMDAHLDAESLHESAKQTDHFGHDDILSSYDDDDAADDDTSNHGLPLAPAHESHIASSSLDHPNEATDHQYENLDYKQHESLDPKPESVDRYQPEPVGHQPEHVGHQHEPAEYQHEPIEHVYQQQEITDHHQHEPMDSHRHGQEEQELDATLGSNNRNSYMSSLTSLNDYHHQSPTSHTPPSVSQRSTLRLSRVPAEELNDINLEPTEPASASPTEKQAEDADSGNRFYQAAAVARSTVSSMTTKMSRAMSISSTTSQGSFSATTVTPASSVANSIHKELPAVPPKIDTTPLSKKPGPIDTAFATLTSSVSSPTNATPTQRFVSGLWSPFKGNASPKPHAIERPSANFAERQRRQSRPPSVAVLPGFQENLLAQMEQLNQANVDDPKTRRVMMQKRKSIRKSIVQHAAPKDGFDWDYWANVLTDFDRMGKNRFVLVQQIRRGVPPPVRGTLWQLLSESHQANILAPGTRYVDLLKQPSPYDKMIQRDLPRTFPGHEYFKDPEGEGQEGLYNVVRAYSVYDGQVGYCQGLAFIVGPLLLNMADEDAFLVLVQLMQTYGLRGHFTPSMEGLHLRLYQFDKLIAEFLPHISGHLQRRGIDATMYASQWFMTLFAYKFPLDLVFRIYDLLFVEGVQVVLKFALALLKRNEKYLLQLDFEPLLDFLKNGLLDSYKGEDALLIHDAMQWDLPKRRMAQLEKEHKQQVAKEEQDARTIQTLQQEQVRLKQQVDEKQEIHDHMAREQQELRDQWQASRMHLDRMKEDQITLQTVVDTLQHEVEILPLRIEEQHKAEFDGLFAENSRLTNKNVHLEDQLAQLEAHLIDFKMRYAQNENDCTQLSKRLYELKKIIDQ